MGLGWKEGLHYIYGNDVTVHLDQKVHRANGEEAGDIDAVICRNKSLKLDGELLPQQELNFRPPQSRTMKGRTFLVEIKRSLGDDNAQAKIETFVQFYHNILRQDGGSSITNIPQLAKLLINDKKTIILFLFNGDDSNRVERLMRNAIHNETGNDSMTICGHDVICIWCPPERLIGWKERMEGAKSKQQLAKSKQQLAKSNQQLAKSKQQLGEANKRIQQLEEMVRELGEQGLAPQKRRKKSD